MKKAYDYSITNKNYIHNSFSEIENKDNLPVSNISPTIWYLSDSGSYDTDSLHQDHFDIITNVLSETLNFILVVLGENRDKNQQVLWCYWLDVVGYTSNSQIC